MMELALILAQFIQATHVFSFSFFFILSSSLSLQKGALLRGVADSTVLRCLIVMKMEV